MKRCLSLLSSLLCVSAFAADPLEVGASAPKQLKALNQKGETVELSKTLASSGQVLVYFYPKADTPGCTKQACSLRDAYEVLKDLGVTVYGVSMDSVEAQKAFHEKYRLTFELIADPEGKVVKAFGVPTRGRFPSRQAFLFEDGKLVWRDLKASTAKQADDVLKVLAQRSATEEETPANTSG
ncbi:MAG: peroxiredoxin [Opitutales bacterium]